MKINEKVLFFLYRMDPFYKCFYRGNWRIWKYSMTQVRDVTIFTKLSNHIFSSLTNFFLKVVNYNSAWLPLNFSFQNKSFYNKFHNVLFQFFTFTFGLLINFFKNLIIGKNKVVNDR